MLTWEKPSPVLLHPSSLDTTWPWLALLLQTPSLSSSLVYDESLQVWTLPAGQQLVWTMVQYVSAIVSAIGSGSLNDIFGRRICFLITVGYVTQSQRLDFPEANLGTNSFPPFQPHRYRHIGWAILPKLTSLVLNECTNRIARKHLIRGGLI